MTRWDKLLERVNGLSNDLRFEEVERLLRGYGYSLEKSTGGSHCVFRKNGAPPICIPRKNLVKRTYVELLKQVVEEGDRNENENEND